MPFALLLFASVPLFAHGQEVLVFPISFALLFVLALAIVAVPWHRWWARIVAGVVLLASNAALWFAPFLPQTAREVAAADLGKVMLTLLVVPIALTAVVIALLTRVGAQASRAG
jgi:hypothetical protein